MTGKVFLNYRRADSEAWADRLFERLVREFPRNNVFMDIDGNIPFGFPWADWLDSQVAACDLMLVLIGRTWVTEFKARSDAGDRDSVLVEIESALKRKIPVVPVFLGDAPTPKAADLPATLRPLLALQAARLQRTSFDSDADVLVKGVARSIALARGEPAPPADARDYQAEGRIKVDAKFIHGAPERWFKPGAGKAEWFKDLDVGPEMVVVPAGSFTMGSNDYDGEKPPHKVTIEALFAVDRFAVTFDEWDAAGLSQPSDQGWGRGRRPVINVSWEDAQAYAKWLSGKTGKAYRLLSEAEWEYCCRAGTTTAFWWGNSISTQQANYDGNHTFGGGAKGEYRRQTVPVDSFEANPWGLYQVHGNVWEWCEDNWHPDHKGAPVDGSVWPGGDASLRVVRGGSWSNYPRVCRSANRYRYQPSIRYFNLGFRLARTL